nr:hypothetical protein [Tanacetum cinerariifolium]
ASPKMKRKLKKLASPSKKRTLVTEEEEELKPAKKVVSSKKPATKRQSAGVRIRDTLGVSVLKKKAPTKAERKSDDDEEEETQDDEYLHTPKHYVATKDKMNDESNDVTEEEYERINKELYGDVNVRLTDDEPNNKDKGDKEMTNAETEDDEHVKDVKELKDVDNSTKLISTVQFEVPKAVKEYLGSSLDNAMHKAKSIETSKGTSKDTLKSQPKSTNKSAQVEETVFEVGDTQEAQNQGQNMVVKLFMLTTSSTMVSNIYEESSIQKKLSNLERDVIFDMGVALQMFTRRIIILKRVEDLQLGVESYQKKLNVTKPETFRSDISKNIPYTLYNKPQGVIYKDKYKRNRLMRMDKLHKFSDGTLTYVRTVLYDIASNLRMDYLPKKRKSSLDKKRPRIMIRAIDQLLLDRRSLSQKGCERSISVAYKTYFAYATGEASPKMKRKLKKLASPSKKRTLVTEEEEELKPAKKVVSSKKPATKRQSAGVRIRDTLGVSVLKKKAPTKAERSKGIEFLYNAALLEEAQLKKAFRRSKRDTTIHQACGSSKGANFESEVLDEPKESDDDEEEETQDDEYLHTPKHYVATKDKMNDESNDVTEEEYERINKELYGDVNVRLTDDEPNNKDKGDKEMTNAETEDDEHVKDVKELKDVDNSTKLISTVQFEVPKAVKEYLGSSLDNAMHKKVPKETITSFDTTALIEFDQKTTLFETMTKFKSFNRSPKQRALYHALIESILEDEDVMHEGVADK